MTMLSFRVDDDEAAAAQQVGTITGQINASGTRQPISGVQVLVVGTTIGGLTNAEGRFTLSNVPVGAHTVRATSLGFGTAEQAVTVTAGAAAAMTVWASASVAASGFSP